MTEGGVAYKRGLALIFSQEYDRDGTEKDIAALQEVLQSMNVAVEVYTSLTGDEIKRTTLALKAKPERFKNVDYVIIVNLSHGTYDGYLEIPNEKKVIEKIKFHRAFLNPLFKIKELDGKLKWLIIQACAGNRQLISQNDSDGLEDYYVKSYVISHASSEGAVAYRHRKYGSIYIQVLCEQLREHSATCGVMEILDNTAKKVPQRLDELKEIAGINNFITQKPTYEKNLVEDFYFCLKDY